MVTGAVDFECYDKMTVDERQAHNMVGSHLGTTNFCHIFPPSTNWNLNPQEHGHPKVLFLLPIILVQNADIIQTKYSGNVWSIVNGFGSINVLAELDGNNAHRLSNGLTMVTELHHIFDNLKLWFEEIPVSKFQYLL